MSFRHELVIVFEIAGESIEAALKAFLLLPESRLLESIEECLLCCIVNVAIVEDSAQYFTADGLCCSTVIVHHLKRRRDSKLHGKRLEDAYGEAVQRADMQAVKAHQKPSQQS